MSTLFTHFVIDNKMRVVKTKNNNRKLFFGLTPSPGQILIDLIAPCFVQQINSITTGIQNALQRQGNSSFLFNSITPLGENTQVCVHVECNKEEHLTLYLIAIDNQDLQEIKDHNSCHCTQENTSKNEENCLNEQFDNSFIHNIQILDALPVGISIHNREGCLIYTNPTNLNIFGLDTNLNNNQINSTYCSILPPAVTDAIKNGNEISNVFTYSLPSCTETTGLTQEKQTKIRHIECYGLPIAIANTEINSYALIFTDISLKTEQEEKVRQNNLKTEIAIHSADIMFWEYDVQNQIFYSDYEPLNNYDNTQPISLQEYINCIHPDDLALIYDYLRRIAEGENCLVNFDVHMMLPGHEGWQYCTLNGTPYTIGDDGHVKKYVGTRKNNTEIHLQKLLLEKILNNIPISIHIKDVANNWKYIFCNNESNKLFGTKENININEILDEEQLKRVRKTDLEVYNSGLPYLGLERISLKNGKSYDMIVSKNIIEENDKRLLLTIRWDQSIENELKRRSKLFDLTLKLMDAFTWYYEPLNNAITFGEGFDKTNRDLSEIDTLEKFLSCVHPDEIDYYVNSLNDVVANESGIWNIECRIDFIGNGDYTWWEARGILETVIINDTPYKYMYGMTISTEAHKQSELTLINSKNKLNQLIHQNELILNNTNSGLAYISTDYIVQWENISTCSSSLSLEAYKKGQKCYNSAHGRTKPCENCVMIRAIASRQMEQIQFKLDSNHMVEIIATPVFKDDDTVDGIVIRIDDITERESVLQELKEAKRLAEQSDKLKSAFLANMSHEIRTPLNAIVGFSELLINSPEDEEREEFINIINSNNELLLKLINDILDLSKIEAGSVELKYEEFDLSDSFDNVAASMRQRITNPNVRIIDINPYSTCTINLDKNRVAQLLTNFVTNAIKYTPKGYIEMGYECTDSEVRLYVKDSGIGIPDEKKSKMFHRFAKLDEFAQGTGLGLSICKAIVESMNGTIGYESTYGEGSLFWVTLPCSPIYELKNPTHIKTNTEVEKTTKIDSLPLPTEKKTLLVAEDIASNFLLLANLLKQHYHLLHAKNGLEAVEMAKSNNVDLILMDMKMPIMDGITATTEIRKFKKKVPIVALTAHAFESDRIAALEAGCTEYLVKPINKPQLMSVLRKFSMTQIKD